ncbi:MAG: MaoC family dehydratase [Rhodospirillum sp.]|nr:MaoC family dehydratase [Rhodospirillum sp.]
MEQDPTENAGNAKPRSLIGTRLETSAAGTARYAALTADFNPIHLDPEFSRNTPFGVPINHGTLGLSLLTQSIEATFGGRSFSLDIRFTRPAPVGVVLIAGGDALPDEDTYDVHVAIEDGPRVIEGTLRLSNAFKPYQDSDHK